jgi:hypothetical protein
MMVPSSNGVPKRLQFSDSYFLLFSFARLVSQHELFAQLFPAPLAASAGAV